MQQQDRNDANTMHAVASGSGSGGYIPKSNRDASKSPWVNAPTQIRPPSNTYGFTRTPNPLGFGSGDQSNKMARVGNSTAKQVIAPPSAKRQKQEFDSTSTGIRSRRKGELPGQPLRSIKGLVKGNKKPILANVVIHNVDDVDEDMGTPYMPPKTRTLDRDELDFLSGRNSSPIARPPVLDYEPKTGLFDSSKPTSSIKAIEQRINKRKLEFDSEDGIEEFTPEKLSDKPSNVKAKIEMYDNNFASTSNKETPHIDLRNVHKKTTSMKPRTSTGTRTPLQLDPVATSSTLFTNKGKAVADRKEGLVIPEMYFGFKHFKDECRVSWDGARPPKLTVQVPKHVVHFKMDRDIESAECTLVNGNMNGKTLVIQIVTSKPPKPVTTNRYSEWFVPGTGYGRGTITLKFNNLNASSLANYHRLVSLLKMHVNAHSINGLASASVWEAAMQRSNMKCAQFERSTVSLSDSPPPTGPIDVISSTPPPASTSQLRKLPNFKKTRNTPLDCDESPVEIISSVPKPRRISRVPAQGIDVDISTPPITLRKSARQSAAASEARPSPPVDPDEIILVYPPGATGAVNITNADLNRLQPGEFLNDTLIEFGLKLWLKELEETDPELAKDVHVFSSFFYKKLQKKNLEEGYQSVRKWTSKFDFFDKKYIIVPINEHVHWYLAIIYLPEYSLLPPTFKSAPISTRGRARLSQAAEISAESPPLLDPVSKGPGSPTQSAREKEEQEEQEVQELFKSSCSISAGPSSDRSGSPVRDDNARRDSIGLKASSNGDAFAREGRPSSPLTDSEDDDISMIVSKPGVEARNKEIEPMVVDCPDSDKSTLDDDNFPNNDASTLFEMDDVVMASEPQIPIQPANFYGKKGKQKVVSTPRPEPDMMDVDEDDEPVDEPVDNPIDGPVQSQIPQTYIFTLDSLGSRHPQAHKILRHYIKMEAKDKRNLDDIRDACAKQASVPVQPNFCDCGLYLLHLAQTFMKDPKHYCDVIMKTKPTTPMAQRQRDWDDAAIGGFREKLARRIQELSVEWKKDRALKEEQKKKDVLEGKVVEVVDSSDDEIEYVVDVAPAKGKTPSKASNNPPGTGKAIRMRG